MNEKYDFSKFQTKVQENGINFELHGKAQKINQETLNSIYQGTEE